MASVTITIPNSDWTDDTANITWEPPDDAHILLGSDLSGNSPAVDIYLGFLRLRISGTVQFQTSLGDGSADPGAGPEFSSQMEQNGTITLIASENSSLVLSGIADSSEPYVWDPANSAEVIAFRNLLAGLTDRSLTVTFNDNIDVAPSFADDTGDAQSWTQNTAITPVTVPAADGTPTPTYAVKGTLPAGIAFNTTTRVISGTPTAVGTGTITIEASNSEGAADWTVDYATVAALAAPSFTDNTGDPQAWIMGQAIAPLTVPVASGNPAPAYAAVGTLPAGIMFNAATRVISGTPTAQTSGRIIIRASNSEGAADWTVAYTTTAARVAPSFTDSTGDAQDWTVGTQITPVIVPAATGNPAPTYAATGFPAGINFNTTTRVISGTPTATGFGTITVEATNSQGSDTWTVAYTTAAAVALLTLADFNDDGLEVETAALLEASDPGTSGNNFYVDVSRGGSGTPIEGELGVGPGETVLDRLRRASTANLTLNDSDSPVTLDFDTFFGIGGDGRDLTVYLQTASDGLVSFTVASAFLNAGGNWLNLTLPAAGRTLLDNLATGDRFIFALARLQPIAPAFADDTGTPQTWVQNQAITPITVPEAAGSPTPTYTAVGALPAGISFNTTTRVISGTPTAAGSGTIRIRATNSEGTADWTVTFTTTAALSTSDWDDTGYQAPIVLGLIPVVISDPDITEQDFTPIGMADIVVAANLSIGQVERRASGIRLLRTSASTGPFRNYFNDEGTPLYPDAKMFLVVRDASNTSVTIPFTISGTGFTFNNWTIDDSNQTALVDSLVTGDRFVLAIAEPAIAPSFVDDTGDAQTWTQGDAITPITVPEADGSPTPAYTAVGALPGGIAFDPTTRVISGTPTAAGSGTITIEATNSEGAADWTVAYTTTEVLVAPSFVDDTGDAQTWTQGDAITPITVPAATGNPTPTYVAVGALPAGIAFDTTSRVLSGTPTAVGSGTITIRATNNQGDDDWTVAYTTTAAPSFVDPTGDAQTWNDGTPITPLTVPEADGFPAPTYAAVGALPAGIAFDTTTRVISGTPTAVGSGTIRIRATNSEGTADWTVAYTTAAALAAPSFVDPTGDAQSWTQGSAITPLTVPEADGFPAPTYAAVVPLPAGIAFDAVTRVISGVPTVVGTGTITVKAINPEGSADWTVAFTTEASIVLVAPSFVDDTGDAQSWNDGTPITPISVPAAEGNLPPTYASVGALPAGIAFDTTTRVISGTPTAVGSGTIRIRATNSEGTADWTVDYTTRAALVSPSFVDPTGDAQSWTAQQAITPLTVPEADGFPTPTYAAVGALPAGIAFDTTTLVISGTPTAVGSGTITIRATNNQGTADWTVAYTTGPPLVAPSFVDDTGDAQSWTQGTLITPLTVPAASGNPTPTYGAVGGLPAGIAFDTSTLVISGTPTAVDSGTITIRATNGSGTADWTVAYTTVADLRSPSFTDPTGDAQSWTAQQAITPLTVPEADGNPAPSYAAVGAVPGGIAFDPTTRAISGTPTAQGSGTIRIRATNNQGTADWTVAYTTGPPLVAPSFTNPTGAPQSWVQNQAIASVTVPAADGNPNPTYAVHGGLPTGISFDPTSRVIYGTPTAVSSGTITIQAANSQGTADWTFVYAVAVGTAGITAQPIPTVLLEVDWAGDGSFSHADSDISADLVGDLEFSRGRGSFGSQLYGRSIAGILTCTLENSSRQYDQLSVQSSIGSLLTSQRRVRVTLAYDGVLPEVAWSGYLDTVEPVERRGGQDIVKFQALGLLALLQESSQPVASSTNEGIGSILGRIVDTVISGLDNSLLSSTRQIANWVRNPRHSSLESSRELEETEAGFLNEHRDGRLVLEGRNFRATGSRVPMMSLVDKGSGDAIAERLKPILRAQDIANIVRVLVRNSSNDTTKVLWSTDQSISIPASSTVRVIAEYPTPSAPRNHAGVYVWETLVAGTDYDAARGLTVTQVAEGNQLSIELANSNTADIAVARLQARGQALILNDPIAPEFRRASSVTTYGPREYKTPAQWLGSVADAEAYSAAILATHAEPRRRLSARWFGNDSPALALSVDLSDRVRVVERGTAILFYVEFIKHRISAGKVHLVEYILSPPSFADVTFIFDTSELDSGVFGF